MFTDSESQGLAKNALLPATQKAYDWMASHQDVIDKYGSLAAYFLSQQQKGQQFSMEAYRAQIEEGFRQRKTPQEFLDGVRITNAGDVYYAAQDQKDAQVAEAQKEGDDQLAENVRKGWSIWSRQFKGAHPAFANHLAQAASTMATVEPEYRNLEQMVHDNDVPGTAKQKGLLAGLVKTFNDYLSEMAKYPTNSKGDTAAKAAMTAAMQQYIDDVLKADPQLTSLYNGVIRPLNERLAYAGPSQ